MKADPVEIAPMPEGLGPEGRVEFLPLSRIQESTTNPRRTVKDAHFEDLVSSVRTHGVLQPILVRPVTVVTKTAPPSRESFELVAGHRRLAAAREALLPNVPAFIRELSDQAALEIQVIENLQRSDLHALEEAQGYQRLIEMKYDVARIAERIGRSAKYVYDRVKLLQLIPAAQVLFLDDRITAGHAIILARLKPADQERAIDVNGNYGGYANRGGAIFIEEHTLFDPDEVSRRERRKEDPLAGYKTRSVRELQAWVDEEVRFDPKAEDLPDLFPETHETLSSAQEQREKIIPITHVYHVPEQARDGGRVYGPQSWVRADGGKKTPTCEYSVTGVIVIGHGRGRAFKVCVSKEKCTTHWAQWQKERASRQRAAARTTDSASKAMSAKESAADARRQEEQAQANRDRKRWEDALPMILPLIAAKFAKMPAGASGLGKHLIELLGQELGIGGAKLNKLMPTGRTADDLVRHLVMGDLMSRIDNYDLAPSEYLKPFGLEADKLMDQVAPVQTSAKAAAPAKSAKKKRARKKAR